MRCPVLSCPWLLCSAKTRIAPGYNRASAKNLQQRPSIRPFLETAHFSAVPGRRCYLRRGQIDPPQATIDPSPSSAASALSDAWMCFTFLSCSWTVLLSPPRRASPRSAQIRRQAVQQMRVLMLGCTAHFPAALRRRCCQRQLEERPRSHRPICKEGSQCVCRSSDVLHIRSKYVRRSLDVLHIPAPLSPPQ